MDHRQLRCQPGPALQSRALPPGSKDASVLKTLVLNTIPGTQIARIERVSNVFLERAYEIRLAEMRLNNPYRSCRVESLIHATAVQNVDSILRCNLNWRLTVRRKYGAGVSFSDNADYANKYCNNRRAESRAFIVCEVIVGNVRRVNFCNYDEVPPHGIDTYQSDSRRVYVKFDDFMFIPKYVIYYHGPQIARPLANERENILQAGARRSLEPAQPRPILVMPDKPERVMTQRPKRPALRIQNPPVQNYYVPTTNLYSQQQTRPPPAQESWCPIL